MTFRRRRRSRSIAVRRGRAPIAAIGLLALLPSSASLAQTAFETTLVPGGDRPDGRAYWRTPLRATRVADGRADWAIPARGVTPRPSIAAARPATPRRPGIGDAIPAGGAADEAADGVAERATEGAVARAPERSSVPEVRSSLPAPPGTPPRRGPVQSLPPRPEPSPPTVLALPAQAPPRSDIEAFERWLRELGIGDGPEGRPCPTTDAVHDALRARRAGTVVEGATASPFPTLLESLLAETNGDALDAGVSRDWSVLRFVCEPGAPDRRPRAGAAADRRDVPAVPDESIDASPEAPDLFVVDDDVPPGFESLAGPQLFWADVWFNGRKAGTTALMATAETISFESPDDVVALIPDVLDPATLLAAVSAPLPTNAWLACFAENDPVGCGVVEADPVAVIWDESRLRLDLFLAAELQGVQSRAAARNLVAPERRGSSILSLYAAGFDTDTTTPGFDVSGRLLSGYGSGYVSTAADYGSRDEEARLRELKLTHQADGHVFTGGTYTWSPGGAWVDVDVLGVGFSTSFDTRVDLEQAFGSELVVYLRRRAVVQLVVDGRVRHGTSYDAGNQVIDTRSLPEGTYPVEIRITEGDGTTRSEFRTFTRSASIPPRGEPVFTLAAGLARNGRLFPGDDEPLVAGFSLANRIGDRAAWRLGMLQIDERSFGQGGLVYLGERVSLRVDGTVGEAETSALGASAGYVRGTGALNLTLERVASNVPRDGDPRLERLYPSDGTRWSVGATRTLGRFSFRASAARRLGSVGGGTPREETRYALGVRRSLFRGRTLSGSVGAEASRVGDDTLYTLRADVRFGRDRWNARLGADTARARGVDDGIGLAADLDYTGEEGGPFDWQAGVFAQAGRRESFGARASLEHSAYRAAASSEVVRLDDGGTSTLSVASASAQVGLDRRGVAIGGAEAARAGVIVSVRGEPAGEPFDIVVDGRREATGRIGTARFIGLRPFASYDVKLVARGLSSNGLGNDVHRFTLYPGNVQRIDVLAEPRVLLIAAIVDEDGAALDNAVVEIDDNPQVTDVGGILQAEVVPGSRLPIRRLDGRRCSLRVPDAVPGTEVLVPDEPLVCAPDEP